MGNIIELANDILKNEKIMKGEPRVYYNLSKYEKMGSYYILTDMSEHVTLEQLMYYLVNLNRAISVFGTEYLTQTTKNYLYLIENNWI